MKKLLQSLFLLMLFAVSAIAQERTVTGTVKSSEDGTPLPGVTVKIKGARTGAITNASGVFSIQVSSGAVLVFSSVGYEGTEASVGNKTNVNVTLRTDAQSLDEVTVQVPYGTVKKTSFTGSESTVNATTLRRQQVTSVTRALEGLVPGIVVTNGGGQPGSGASILIRGVGSVNASSAPLYVLDGAVYNGSIASLSMDDIESVTVLKDAAAAALYGSRGANGVIMLKSKQGRKGTPQVNANLRTGWSTRGIPEYDRLGSKDYYEMMWEATRNRLQLASGQTRAVAGQNASNVLTGANGLVYNAYNVPGNTLVDPTTGKLNPNAQLLWEDNWSDVLFQTGKRQDFNLNISGASDKTDYYVSMGYLKEEGTAKFTDYERYNIRLNLNSQVRNWLKAGVSMDGALTDQANNVATGTATTNPFYYSRMMGPIYPVYQRNLTTGAYIVDPATGQNALDYGKANQMGLRPYAPNSNLLGTLPLDDRSTKPFNINANTYLEATFLKDFKLRSTLASTYYDAYATTFQNSLFGDADNVAGRSTKQMNRQFTYTFNQVLTWNKSFGDHNLTVLAGHENYFFRQNVLSATRTGFPFPGTSELAPAATPEASTSYQYDHRIEAYFSRVDYNFQNKYFVSGSFRTDGGSRFADGHKWGQFYSASAAWRLSQENFLKSATWINELKLKASYGEQGNEDLGTNYYPTLSLYQLGNNNVNAPGALINSLANPDLVWEKSKNANIGVDFAMFNNRLSGTVEVYNRVSDNLLFPVPLPLSTGISTITQNIGTLYNRGIDVSLGYSPVRTSNFEWRVDLNLTHFKNKITKLPQEELISGTKKLMVGKSIYDFWIKEYAGVDPANGDALYYQDKLDAAGKPTGERITINNINNASFYYKGTSLPNITGGLTNTFTYKEFDLSFLFTGQQGGKFYDGNYAGLMHVGSYGTAWSTDILNRWTTPGQVTDVPRVQNALATQSGVSTRFLYNASFVNLKNASIGYRMPKRWATTLGIQGARIFGTVDNAKLWTFDGPKGMDPQRSITGVSDYTYPIYRTFTLGLNVNL
ncbi:SusC/RagA family TonB-linked outer membrane protein [Pedobacter duraquae]|uniref:TonB-linked SusC/RagA family outer membrane protein n=1 Tax=Pedobacter duraquae TaxID=425511 RepID=A0A4R6ICJ5_9SPHI|nr:TonB-dependent receptor [Pedobacter duraquae]TDO19297.1 TonB-linked SusC/RagA family outer membrane protein [Pedobacter duraquae]